MITVQITESTPHNMLRAIRAACNELLGGTTAADLTGAGIPVPSEERASALLAEQSTLASAFDKAVETVGALAVAQPLVGADPSAQLIAVAPTDEHTRAAGGIPPAPETDSTGAEWNAELHASTKAKNQDGTWKKRRGAGGAVTGTPGPEKEGTEVMVAEPNLTIQDLPNPGVVHTALPPLPPAPPAAPLVTMNDIYALISGGKCVLNDVIAAAQAMGFSDVGAFSRDATPEQRAQLLQELTA